MDEMLKTGLLPDEKILWRGKAEPFTTLDKTHKKRFVICAGIGLLITALVAAAYFAAVARGGLQAKPDKWREICVVGQSAADGSDVCTRFVFYAVNQPEELKNALSGVLFFS